MDQRFLISRDLLVHALNHPAKKSTTPASRLYITPAILMAPFDSMAASTGLFLRMSVQDRLGRSARVDTSKHYRRWILALGGGALLSQEIIVFVFAGIAAVCPFADHIAVGP
jgi:hypothetical protein